MSPFYQLQLKLFFLYFLILKSISLSGQISNQENDTDQNSLATVIEQPPRFPGGKIGLTNFVKKNLEYPVKAKENKIEGTCYLTFVIETDGRVSNIKIFKGIPNGVELDSEAVRIVRAMPKWIPAYQNGNSVRVQFNLPIRFSLSDQKKKEKNISNVFSVNFNCKTLDKKYKDLFISIIEVDSTSEQLIKKMNDTPKFYFSFGHQKDYLVRFEKEGYPTKEIFVTTKNISKQTWDHTTFNEFLVSVNLVPYTQNTSKSSHRVGAICYSELLGDFDFAENYNVAKSGKDYNKKREAIKAYDLGVNYYRQGKLIEADSLFKISLESEPNADTFYNKAIVNKKLRNFPAYCTNIEYAKGLGDKESSRLFLSDCCSIDSFYVSENYKKAEPENYFYKLKFVKSKYSPNQEFYRYTNKNKMDLAYIINSTDTVYTFIPENILQPFIDTVAKYVSKIYSTFIEYPDQARTGGMVHIQFIINESGSIENVKIIKAPTNELAKEALKAMSLLPKFKPFIFQGRPVKLQLNQPVKFSSS